MRLSRCGRLGRVQLERAALQAILDHSPEGIVVADRKGRITFTNQTVEDLYGRAALDRLPLSVPAESGMRHPDGRLFRPEELPMVRSLRFGESITDCEITMIGQDGSKRFLLADTWPIVDDQGRFNGAVGIFRDVTRLRRDRIRINADRDNLREKINERTTELQASIRALEAEVVERRQVEKKLRKSKCKLQRLSRHTLEALEYDRQKMAKELHDSIGASLSAIKFIVEEKQAQIENSAAAGEVSLAAIIRHLTDTIKETKGISARLRPSTLDNLGLRATLAWYCREFAARHTGIRIEQRIHIRDQAIPDDYKIVIYRIVQEAMGNAARHGRPTVIRIGLEMDHRAVQLSVLDNGQGFDPRRQLTSEAPPRGYGLQNMRERTEICGGAFTIASRKGAGTRISVRLPLDQGMPADISVDAETCEGSVEHR